MFKGRKNKAPRKPKVAKKTKAPNALRQKRRAKLAFYCLAALAVFVIARDVGWLSYQHTQEMAVRTDRAAQNIDAEIAAMRELIAISPTASSAASLPAALMGPVDFIDNIKSAKAAAKNSEKNYAAKLADTPDFANQGHAITETGKIIVNGITKNNRNVIAQYPIETLTSTHMTPETYGALVGQKAHRFGATSSTLVDIEAPGLHAKQWPIMYTTCSNLLSLAGSQLCFSETPKGLQLITLLFNILKLFGLGLVAVVLRTTQGKKEEGFNTNKLGADLDLHDVSYWQFDGQLFDMNMAARSRLGFQPEDPLTIQAFLAHVSPEYHGGVLENFKIGMKEGFVRLEIPFSIRGQIIWMAMEGQGIMALGRPVLAGTFHNISHIYARMMEAGTTSRSLQDALNLYAGPFALWDAKGRLVFWNGAFEKDFGLTGRVQAGHAYDRVARRRASSVKSESMVEAEPDATVFELFSDKFIKVIERRVPNQGMITLGVDITENVKNQQVLSSQQTNLKSMVRKLEQSEGRASELTRKYAEEKKKAERAAKSKTDFLSNMSHELRTPLNAINGFSEMIQNEMFGPLGDPRYKEYAGDINASGQHLLEMINDILDMAKIEAGKMTINPQFIDPLDPVKAAMRMVHGRAREKNIKLLFIGAKDLSDIKADHRAIRQMILNLTSNAIKFTHFGGEVRVRVDHGHQGIVFAVEDTGVGIPKNEIGRLAKPFEQASTTQDADHEGTGLGLALTKAFTDLHNGRFYIESELGVGTVVAFELPVDPEVGLAAPSNDPIADVA